jgi:hypothetical protein
METSVSKLLLAHLFSDAVLKSTLYIPDFKRPYVWELDQVVDLLNSINNNAPIGCFTILETVGQIPRQELIGQKSIPGLTKTYERYLLDGRQRLAALAVALRYDHGVYFDAKEGYFTYTNENTDIPPWWVPTNKLLNTIGYLAMTRKLSVQDDGVRYVTVVGQSVSKFQKYHVPVIQVVNATYSQAMIIAQREEKL